MGSKGIDDLVKGLMHAKCLKQLSLIDTGIQNSEMSLLALAIERNETLETLDISSNGLTFEGFKYLIDSLSNTNIKELIANNNLLGDQTAEYFAKHILSAESDCPLQSFSFSSCKIYDTGLISLLKELAVNKKITSLRMNDNYFTQEVDYIVANLLTSNTTLLKVKLKRNRLSMQCLKK